MNLAWVPCPKAGVAKTDQDVSEYDFPPNWDDGLEN